PERYPEQGQVLDEELPRGPREGGEAAGTRRPDARRRDQEAQGREEHPDRQGAAEGGNPRRERASGDEQRDGDLDDAKHGREAWYAYESVHPTHQRAVGDERTDPLGLVRRELHEADPRNHDRQAVASQPGADRFHLGTQRTLFGDSILYQSLHHSLLGSSWSPVQPVLRHGCHRDSLLERETRTLCRLPSIAVNSSTTPARLSKL